MFSGYTPVYVDIHTASDIHSLTYIKIYRNVTFNINFILQKEIINRMSQIPINEPHPDIRKQILVNECEQLVISRTFELNHGRFKRRL